MNIDICQVDKVLYIKYTYSIKRDNTIENPLLKWDDAKEQINIKKHGLSFSVAARVFEDPDRIEIYDEGKGDL